MALGNKKFDILILKKRSENDRFFCVKVFLLNGLNLPAGLTV